MNYDEAREYLLDKPGAEETFPFGAETMVPKVGGKMFGLLTVPPEPLRISLKCDPFKAQDLRETYPAVTPGYYLNKRHWNTVEMDGSVTDDLIKQWIDDSYELVFGSLPKTVQAKIRS